jgi:hypothetical protein
MSGAVEPADGGMDSFAVIQRWNELSPEHLKAAMKVFDAQLARAHELKMTQTRLQDEKARREHTLFMTSMILGSVVILVLISGAFLLSMHGQIALPVGLTTLSASMATVFVLRIHDPQQMRAVIEAQARLARSAAGPTNAVRATSEPTNDALSSGADPE